MTGTDRRRVVITGMGLITALGNDLESNWAAMLEGRSGVRRIEAFDPSRVDAQIAGEVRDFDASHVLDRKERRRTDRYIAFGLVAVRRRIGTDVVGEVEAVFALPDVGRTGAAESVTATPSPSR